MSESLPLKNFDTKIDKKTKRQKDKKTKRQKDKKAKRQKTKKTKKTDRQKNKKTKKTKSSSKDAKKCPNPQIAFFQNFILLSLQFLK